MVATMRQQAADTATALLRDDPRVAIVLAEISTEQFGAALAFDPSRAVNVGIMEAAMVGVAAGFAMEGFHPIAHTIAPFMVERPFEQLKLDFGYQGLGGTFISTGGSYDYATEGATHHGTGDVGVLLTIPGFEILVPGHAGEVDLLLRASYADGRPTYLRASAMTNRVPEDVEPGRIQVMRRGTGPTMIAVGPMLDRVTEATHGMDPTILYVTSVTPFDAETVASVVGDTPHVISVEPFFEGTLTGPIAAALQRVPSRIASIGVPRRFPTAYGTPEEHDRDNGLDAAGIRARVASILAGGG